MAWYKITEIVTGEIIFIKDDLMGYDTTLYTIEPLDKEPTEIDSAIAALDINDTQKLALNIIEDKVEQISGNNVSHIRRHIAIVMIWNEIQRLKLLTITNSFNGLSLEEKARHLPTLAAIAQQSAKTIPQVATALETRLWERVKRLAFLEAKRLLAHDSIRTATTKDDKISIANLIDLN